MDALNLNDAQKNMVTVYALLNRIAWMCENGVQFNLNTQPVVDRQEEQKDKVVIWEMARELFGAGKESRTPIH